MTDETAALAPRRVGRPKGSRIQREEARPEPVREARPDSPGAQKRLTRKRKAGQDKFYVDPKIIPPGMSWEYKAAQVYGKPNTFHMNQLRENHWVPVPQSSLPLGVEAELDGMILMGRPSYLTAEAKQEDFDIANQEVLRVTGALKATPDGTMPRKLAQINRTRDTMIPEDTVER